MTGGDRRNLAAARMTAPASTPDLADPAPVLQLIVVSAVEILQGSAGVIALLEGPIDAGRLVPRASYGLPAGAVTSLHPRLDRAILGVLGQLGEQVSVLYVPSGFGDWAHRYHVLALPMQHGDQLLGVIYVFRPPDAERLLRIAICMCWTSLLARQRVRCSKPARPPRCWPRRRAWRSMQSTFVSIVSHELQTPVAIIKSYAATLAREDADWPAETVQRVSHNIEEECDRLHRLITDLLDLSRIQGGRVAMRVGSVDLAAAGERGHRSARAALAAPQPARRASRSQLSRSSRRRRPAAAGAVQPGRRTRSSTARTAVKRWLDRSGRAASAAGGAACT